MPVFLTQPYIYIANNYDNFDCLVKNLPKFSCGLRMLFPFVSLTGLKFVMPNLVPATVYLTSTELTTLTMFYDAYYDFGVIGVFCDSSVVIGVSGQRSLLILLKKVITRLYIFFMDRLQCIWLLHFYNMVQQSCDMVLADHYRDDLLLCRI